MTTIRCSKCAIPNPKNPIILCQECVEDETMSAKKDIAFLVKLIKISGGMKRFEEVLKNLEPKTKLPCGCPVANGCVCIKG